MQIVDTQVVFSFGTLVIPAYAKLLLISAIFGLTIGAERAWHHKVASARTFGFICAGSCLFSLLSVLAITIGGVDASHRDITRIAAGIVTGIGFVGGGVIFKTANRVEGITSASMIWITSGIGMACGFNEVGVAFWGLLTYWFVYFSGLLIYRFMDMIQQGKNPRTEEKRNYSNGS